MAPESKPPTLRDVAQAAHVSPSTAAAALRGSSRVHADTRRRVQRSADSLGYAIQMAARILRGGRPPIAAVSSNYISSQPHLMIIQGLVRILQKENFNLLLTPPDEDSTGDRLHRVVEEGLIGGLIALAIWRRPSDSRRTLDSVLARGIPVVTVEFRHPRAHSVEADNEAGGRLAAGHLRSRCKRFLVLTADNHNGQARARGFVETLRGTGLPSARIRVQTVAESDVEAGMEMASRMRLDPKAPLGIFSAWGDLMAWGLLKGFQSRGLKAGKDYALVGFDDLTLTRHISPGLTTVRQPLDRMGECAAEILIEAFRNPRVETMRRILPPELVVRESA